MTTVAGVFDTAQRAQRAATILREAGLGNVNLLMPGATEAQVDAVPISETEQSGMGAAIGGLVGGAVGAAGGIGLGTAAATLMIPGVGPVLAMGLAAAALFGVGGAVGGAAAGAALEEESKGGLPVDELFVYKDALRQGKSVIFVEARDAEGAEQASAALTAAGAESLDAAREKHWIGLRGAEREHYQTVGGDFEKDERDYRRGFEAALGQDDNVTEPRYGSEAFRYGYERGLAHRESQRGES